jgi:hypothetical protein
VSDAAVTQGPRLGGRPGATGPPLGPSMENTRFFFADAAVQSAITRIDPDGDLAGTQPYIQAANAALRGLVAEYIRLRIEEHRASSLERSR